ncbi:hypothetical protein A3K34_04805 [candidate division WWE3 bacterium RIFOXYC1_FULL_40_10]|uniref:4-oxalocrotonate tautomerase domain-containing protein n=1 Tax=candidate division WWE3 bacterium RIFOXYA2_FULL_46_9 TaxID=1802636 RepID=A0A1F4W164_UNCKA|nr:MAG: hypothetical protein A3K58_04805 [candidate division WWE3 bacterium RIFOXYB1_FULL_40_22]OGC62158.1 MAG: hypothetical protein A3K37_04805 [candidate division WWE3 bacterium RIFOXYA1_FULL_40_11]OGC63172.1 MAG: hypothetical protein A2264_00555 [candidate division WWE3 bacterium RIFOXYA2_FULL_46_9]OGC65252.1 MAG: hypothetical protein A2326_04190 [candidate division WWE3 bacterium RIFOXYB2_FULL_41_6]OGC66541.1 MAG: hypothetical protein A3K34_04805 [candidate division WWE3 bacterium RIFOXYC1_
MPIISIQPKTREIENELDKQLSVIRAEIKEAVQLVWKLPPHDIIVNLDQCTIRNADPAGSAFVVFIDTNPNETLETSSGMLRDTIARVFTELGLTAGRNVEIWPRFLPGPWVLIFNGKVEDSVDHH